ncbi:MAG: hypothetical protein RLY58_1951 [Pseudomonadota bacterium]
MFGKSLAALGQQLQGFDSVAGDAADQLQAAHSPVDEKAIVAAIQNLRMAALIVVLRTADAIAEDTLDEDMLPSDLLAGLMLTSMGMEEDDSEHMDDLVNQHLTANVADALSTFGVSDTMIADMLSDDTDVSDAAIEAASEIVIANMPAEGDELDKFMNEFVYGFEPEDVFSDSDDEAGFDGLNKPKKLRVGSSTIKTDASGRKIRYKAVKVVRNHKIVVVNKRLAGQKVKLSAKQKQGLKKMLNKSHSFGAINKRLKSLHIGVKANVYKGKRAGHAAAAIKGAGTGLNKHYGDS